MIRNYVKVALKVLARRKFFTFISLFGISLTLVVLMVGSAVLDNLFSPGRPESRADRTLGVYVIGMYGSNFSTTGFPGYKFLDQYMRNLPGAEKTTIFSIASPVPMYHEGTKIDTHLRRTDGAYWEVLDHRFLEGRPFSDADDRNANPVAVITADMREKLFRGGSALGRSITVDGQTFRVVGVVDTVPITRFGGFSEIWVPIGTMKASEYREKLRGGFAGFVLARRSSDFPALRRAFDERLSRFVFDDPQTFNIVKAGLDTSFEGFARLMFANRMEESRVLILRLVLIGGALLFMTLPALNLMSINLSRILERAPEIGVRKAFGASTRALIGQFVVENVVLTLIGGVIGFALAVGAIALLNQAQIIPYMTFEMNFRVFFYGVLLSCFFGVASGVYPAWRMSRMQAVEALRGGAR